jgi:hypothetical protein
MRSPVKYSGWIRIAPESEHHEDHATPNPVIPCGLLIGLGVALVLIARAWLS